MRQDGEPSVDQILRSIKKVMARDAEREFAAPPRAEPDAADPLDPADPDEAEELRQLADPDPAPRPESALEEEPRLAQAELVEPTPDDLIEDWADGEAAFAAEAAEPAPLTSAAAGASMRRSLAALAMLADPDAPIPHGGAGDAALEAVVRDLLRPLLSQWLEDHLPAIVEREVRAEIARITGQASGSGAGDL